MVRRLPRGQCVPRLVRDIRGQEQEARTNHANRASFGSLAPGFIRIPAKAPQGSKTAGHLDGGIEAEADERDAAGKVSGRQGDDTLRRVPGDGEVLQPPPAACGGRTVGGWNRDRNRDIDAHWLIVTPLQRRANRHRLTRRSTYPTFESC